MSSVWYVLVDEAQGIIRKASTSPLAIVGSVIQRTLPIELDPTLYFLKTGEAGEEWSLLPSPRPSSHHAFDPLGEVWQDQRDTADIDAESKRAFDDAVNAERTRRIRAGTSVSVTGLAVQVALQGRDEDQRTLQGLCTAAQIRIGQGDVTTVTKYRDMDNTDHMLTPPQVVEMWSLGSAWVSAIYQKSWDIKDMDPRPTDHTDDALWSV